MKFYFKDCPSELTMIDYLNSQLSINPIDTLADFKFYEFSLEELGLPPADKLLDATLNIEKKIGGVESWREKNKDSENYKGFSLTHNPDFIDQRRSIFYQGLGAYELPQSFSKNLSKADFKQNKNSYYDSYSFNEIHTIIKQEYSQLIQSMHLPISRSRVVYFYSGQHSTAEYMPYHKDEYPFQLLRINIPLITTEEYKLEIFGTDEFGNSQNSEHHLKVGKAYVWNTRIPHRVYCNDISSEQKCRIHIVLGLIPWFNIGEDKDEGKFLEKNSFFGLPVKEIVEKKLFVKKK